jgi:hypothetical protein
LKNFCAERIVASDSWVQSSLQLPVAHTTGSLHRHSRLAQNGVIREPLLSKVASKS